MRHASLFASLQHVAEDDDCPEYKHGGEGHVHKVTTPSFFDLALKAAYAFSLGKSSHIELSLSA